jgi:hypothetical protein
MDDQEQNPFQSRVLRLRISAQHGNRCDGKAAGSDLGYRGRAERASDGTETKETMSDVLHCGRVHEKDGEIVSVAIWDVAEFVPIGSTEHKAMVAQRLRILPVEEVMPNDAFSSMSMRTMPTPQHDLTGAHQAETSESKLVGRAERVKTWRFLLFALGLFWLAVGLAAWWRHL